MQAGREPQLCPHGVAIGVEHGVIFTDTGMCRCCQVSFYLHGSGMYEGNRYTENKWEPDDLCHKCGGHNVFFDSAVLDAEVAEKLMGRKVTRRREHSGWTQTSRDGKTDEPIMRDVWVLENGEPVPAYCMDEEARQSVVVRCEQLGIAVEETDPRRMYETALRAVTQT